MSQPAGDLLELTVDVDGEAAEAVCELFERYGGGAVVETLLAADGQSGRDLAAPRTRVRTYIGHDDVEARARIEVGLWHLGRLLPIPDACVRKLAHANWAEAWKEHYTAQRIGSHFVVVPSWLDEATGADDLVIRLDPGMSFGTGLHPTTRLCLAEIETRVVPGCGVLDVGTGSGILAIGAARCGASRVMALDTSSESVATAAENARRNGVAVETFAGELTELAPERFDLVVANLLATTVIELAPALAERVTPDGVLVASGILQDQAEDVAGALGDVGLSVAGVRSSGDWVALVASRGPADR